MSQTALIVAIIGLALSAASLSWQAATFVYSGSRVRAVLRHGARNASVAVTGLPGTQSLDVLAGQGLTEEVLGIEARNVGRLAASVVRVSVALGGGVKVEAIADLTAGPPLPFRLDPQNAASWFIPARPIRRMISGLTATGHGSDPRDMWMELELGTGKVIRTKQRMTLGGLH